MEDERKAYKFTFTFDAYVSIQADSEEDARDMLLDVETAVEETGHGLAIFDAYGITDNQTDEEIREVH